MSSESNDKKIVHEDNNLSENLIEGYIVMLRRQAFAHVVTLLAPQKG